MKDNCFEYTPKFENGVQTGVTITHIQTGQILEVESLFFKFPNFTPYVTLIRGVTHVIPEVTTFTGEPIIPKDATFTRGYFPNKADDKQGNNGC